MSARLKGSVDGHIALERFRHRRTEVAAQAEIDLGTNLRRYLFLQARRREQGRLAVRVEFQGGTDVTIRPSLATCDRSKDPDAADPFLAQSGAPAVPPRAIELIAAVRWI